MTPSFLPGSGPLGPVFPALRPHSEAQIAPSAHMIEHFDDEDTVEDQEARAASKAKRGWEDSAQVPFDRR
jgi:hypothetical protein